MNDYEKIVVYVDTASTLAESIKKDIEEGDEITNETIAALNAFAMAAIEIGFFIDIVESKRVKLN